MVGEGADRRFRPRHARICATAATSWSWATPSPPSARSRRTAKEFPEDRFPVRLRRRAGRAEFRRLRQLDPRAGLSVRHDRRQDVEDRTPSARSPRWAFRRSNRLVNAFFAGAKEVNPDVKSKVTFIGSFFDPPKAKEAAIAQIDAGVDVIYAERFGVIEAAQEKKIFAISNMSDQSSLAPDTVITGPVWDMYPTVEQAIKLVKAGVFTAQDYGDFSRMAKGGSYLAPYHDFDKKLPAEVKDLVEKKKAEIMEGNFRVDVDENTPRFGLSLTWRRGRRLLLPRFGGRGRLAAELRPMRDLSPTKMGQAEFMGGDARRPRSSSKCAASPRASARCRPTRPSISGRAGEILGLLGENGAGKTTLMNILFGAYAADAGKILVEGRPVAISSSADALAPASAWCTSISIWRRALRAGKPADRHAGPQRPARPRRRAGAAGRNRPALRAELDPDAWSALSVGEQQRLEIVKALFRGASC